jgi:manganese/iron transport system ATP-binding protein/manganese/zinc/iron transport system ATP- binding protein
VSTGALVEVKGLEAGYAAGEPVISGLDFEITTGELVAILGPNGGGKTTLFRALLGETPQRSGRVELGGSIAYVPQTERSRLDFPTDALGVVLMGTYARTPWYRRLGRDQRGIAERALERVGLAAEATTRYGELSGGQRQRVLIARALAQEARVLLLDEPLTGVDRVASRLVLTILGELRDEGRAILVSTHDIRQAEDFDTVLCLNGRQVACGPPSDVLTPPTLEATYGSELVVLPDGARAVVVQHHHH